MCYAHLIIIREADKITNSLCQRNEQAHICKPENERKEKKSTGLKREITQSNHHFNVFEHDRDVKRNN